MATKPPTDTELEEAASRAATVWTYRTDDEVWTAIFNEGENVAAELLERIQATPDWTVGDLTHKQCIDAILRRYPILDWRQHS